jgi:hyperosmotically inducible protein
MFSELGLRLSFQGGFQGMSNRITGLIATVAISLSVAACDSTANRNANNANANANTGALATPSPTAVANANTDNRRAPTREEYERDRERYDREARESGRTVGTGANDGWLWVKTRYELATADDLRDSTINVDVDNAVVTLSGTVASAAQKTRAEQVAKGVEDVRSVRNQLRVVSDNANGNGNANSNTRRGNANR